jgi:putative transposon-encoded protein
VSTIKVRQGKPVSVSFETTVLAMGNNTGIVVPDDKVAELGAGKRPAVLVNLNGYEYPNTVGVMGGKHLISVSAAVRKQTGLSGGDQVRVTLTLADGPRKVDVPKDFEAALAETPQAQAYYVTLSNSLQRYHVDTINAAKTDETRKRRIDKAVSTFLSGKPR